jgi:hypothetical protein
MEESWSIEGPWEDVVATVEGALIRRHLCVESRFDLRSAVAAYPDCECPHHGRTGCTCQYRVLQVYRAGVGPVVISLHARDGRARIQLSTWEEAGSAEGPLPAEVARALEDAVGTRPGRVG